MSVNLDELKRAAESGGLDAWYKYGYALSEAYRDDDAEMWLNKAADGGHTNACLELMALYMSTGRAQKAEDMLGSFIASYDEPLAKVGLGVIRYRRLEDFDSIRMIESGVRGCEEKKQNIFQNLKQMAIGIFCSDLKNPQGKYDEDTVRWLAMGIKLLEGFDFAKIKARNPQEAEMWEDLLKTSRDKLHALTEAGNITRSIT